MIEIKPLEKKFVAPVVQLEECCFGDSWSQAGVEAELTLPTARFFVAEDAGLLAGYISAAFVVDECAVNRVAVTPEYRRHGVGSLLMQSLLKQAWTEGMSYVTLEVRQSNENAVAFYKKLGFDVLGVRKNFYRFPKEDAVLMTIKRGADMGI